jgi:LysM repeat protein
MLYIVKPGDTLSKIAQRFNTSVAAIMDANVICNENLIFDGEALIIPVPGLVLPKSGGSPFYVVLPGDTLFCLAKQFNTTVSRLAKNNQITNPNLIKAYSELMVLPVNPNAAQLEETWDNTPGADCLIFEPQRFGIYYLGTFQWYALGLKALSPLLELINHRCPDVRFYAILSLGRIARDVNGKVKKALKQHFNDPDPFVAEMARLAYRRLRLAEQGYRRTHLLIGDDQLIPDLNNLSLPTIPLTAGTAIIVLRWHIPSPTGEEGPKGDIQLYDQVEVINTGETGFIARRGNNEINIV